MSVADEAKDLLAGKPKADLKFMGPPYSRNANLVIVRDGRDGTMRDLKKLKNAICVYMSKCQISSFKKGKRRVYFLRATDLNEVEAQSIQDYYDWVVK